MRPSGLNVPPAVVNEICYGEQLVRVGLRQRVDPRPVFRTWRIAVQPAFQSQKSVIAQLGKRSNHFRFRCVHALREGTRTPAIRGVRPEEQQRLEMSYRTDVMEQQIPDFLR